MTYKLTQPLVTSQLIPLDIEHLKEYRDRHYTSVLKRLSDFKALKSTNGDKIFYEMCYCILTPQSSGVSCDRVVHELVKRHVLGDPARMRGELEETLKKTRFWKKKSKYIVKAWDRFYADRGFGIGNELLDRVNEVGENREARNWLREEMRGMGIGLKEASHFLRNIGYGGGLAIVDRHIIGCLGALGVIKNNQKVIKSDKDYISIEEKMIDFSKMSKIPLEELDLILWSAKTGYIFK
jgi:N-glycosylase/DNA lyase